MLKRHRDELKEAVTNAQTHRRSGLDSSAFLVLYNAIQNVLAEVDRVSPVEQKRRVPLGDVSPYDIVAMHRARQPWVPK